MILLIYDYYFWAKNIKDLYQLFYHKYKLKNLIKLPEFYLRIRKI